MPVDLSSPPAASAVDVSPATAPNRTVDPAFAERWNAWVVRGRQHDLAVRRKARVVAIVVIAAGLVALALRLTGGSL